MKPSIGRIVHFSAYPPSYGSPDPIPMTAYPAMVTTVNFTPPPVTDPDRDAPRNYTVGLTVFTPLGVTYEKAVHEYEELPCVREGTWSWPPRV